MLRCGALHTLLAPLGLFLRLFGFRLLLLIVISGSRGLLQTWGVDTFILILLGDSPLLVVLLGKSDLHWLWAIFLFLLLSHHLGILLLDGLDGLALT